MNKNSVRKYTHHRNLMTVVHAYHTDANYVYEIFTKNLGARVPELKLATLVDCV